MTQLDLFRQRRFGAMFWTQFLGALNDNVFKNALVILIAYKAWTILALSTEQLVALCGGIFILPFFLFSATAGQLGDKLSKPRLVRWIKAAEIGVMGIGAVGFAAGNLPILLLVLFLMGLQSTFFGPVKYSILPQLLSENELVGGNALVETGTFLAILLGTILGGALVAGGETGLWLASFIVIAVAMAGWASSLLIPALPAENPALRFSWNPLPPSLETYRVTRSNRSVFLSILGASWFWFFGAAVLSVLPVYTKDVLRANEHVITFFLALFCTGIACGSLLCERLSERKLELGLVPFGSIGMTLFAFDLFLVGRPEWVSAGADLAGLASFLGTFAGLRITADLLLLAAFSGFFIVPLYTLIQQRSDPQHRSRVIAGNNILGALFMLLASLMLVGLFAAGLSVPQIFAVLALLNAAVAIYIYKLLPEFLFRFMAWIIANIMYRLKTVNRERIPVEGAALLVCNHASFADWLVIASACKRPVRFVMYHGFLKLPLLGWFFRDAKVIPIAPARESGETLEAAYDRIAAELAAGEIVCIFPEGTVTKDGKMNPFRPGVEKIVGRTPVPVIPMALCGMWGSFFSRKYGRAMSRPFRRVWSRISLVIGEPVAPENVSADDLARRVAALGGFEPPELPQPSPVPGGGSQREGEAPAEPLPGFRST
jgi:1-acyl-sn-glycerol-3-phosphate acyltransferase